MGLARSVRLLAELEDAKYALKMITMPRSQGRKPFGYVPLQTVEDVGEFSLDNPLNLPEGAGGGIVVLYDPWISGGSRTVNSLSSKCPLQSIRQIQLFSGVFNLI